MKLAIVWTNKTNDQPHPHSPRNENFKGRESFSGEQKKLKYIKRIMGEFLFF
jgi:hypothetical protein